MSDWWRLMIVCDIQLVMGIQLLVWIDERLVLGNGWSMVSDRFIGNELASGKKSKVMSDMRRGMGMRVGWFTSAGGWLLIVDSLWVTFEGDGVVVWWVIGGHRSLMKNYEYLVQEWAGRTTILVSDGQLLIVDGWLKMNNDCWLGNMWWIMNDGWW